MANIVIDREEVKNQLQEWNCDFIGSLEERLGRELTDLEYKKVLIHCLGYLDNSSGLIEELLNEID